MAGGVGNGIDDASLLDASVLALLLTHEHFHIHDELVAIAARDAIRAILAIDEGLILPFEQVVVVLLGDLSGNVCGVDLWTTAPPQPHP